jgi:hypothetical protein
VDALHAAHQRNVEDGEFVVARRSPPTIWKIANDNVECDQPTAWIGDHTAFVRPKEVFHGPSLSFPLPREFDPDGGRQVVAQLMDAFRVVLLDDTLDSVGDARVVVTADADGFRYLPYMEMDNGLNPPTLPASPGEEIDLLRPGTGAVGAFAYSVLVPVDAAIGLVAVHVLQASLGFVYYPAASIEAVVFRNVSAPQLIERINDLYGVLVSGILFGVPPGYEPPAFRSP